MKKSRFTTEQIIAVLKEAEAGAKIVDLMRQHGLSEQTFYSVPDARAIIEAWWVDYNTVRPHSSLGQLTPAEFLERYTQQTSVVPEARIDASAHPNHRPGLTPELVS